MSSENMNASPVNPIPPVVLIIAILVFSAELVLQAGENGLIGGPAAIGWRLGLIENYSFFDPIFEHMLENRDFTYGNLLRLISYPVVHSSLTHAFFASVMILALGKKVAEEFSGKAVLVIVPIATLAGSITYGLIDNAKVPLYGAFPVVYGLLGAYSWILWLALDGKGRARWAAFRLVGFLLALQLLWYLFYGGQRDWIAFAAGFVSGFGLSFVLSPDAGPRVRRWVESIRG